jgi:hypothetical protein
MVSTFDEGMRMGTMEKRIKPSAKFSAICVKAIISLIPAAFRQSGHSPLAIRRTVIRLRL